ncbi:GNAT family N-acetyltransferase [Acaricomes phytoseiuli]|uniref:GNAT family N-acetyltransferase n=1 Tax=Acaricomes phytoseiuli TaxID=291968 RepID=UPI00035EEAB6|nr:GNAT family N-acetyltransferase [Acaricomes phytoseiuli]
MSSPVTLIAQTSPLPFELDISTRALESADIAGLGELYFTAYDAGLAEASLEEAKNVMAEIFDGKLGSLLSDASHAALSDDGSIVAAILVVERATHEGAPESPFLIELFTDRAHRRRGLAERLVLVAGDKLFHSGHQQVAVRVDDENSAALALYLSMDFRRWDAEEQED